MKTEPSVEGYRLLRGFVRDLREFVRGQLAKLHGDAWVKRGVPEEVRKRWQEREREAAQNPWRGTQASSLLDFSDEGDLKDIILRRDNFDGVFRGFFGSDGKMIETKLNEIKWIRDDVAHFRPMDREQLAELRARCREINLCIARAAKIQADSEAPERLLPPAELLAGDKDPAELLAAVQKRAALAEGGDAEPMTDEQLAALRAVLLDVIFEQGAYPDESDVEATRIHWRFNEWNRAPESEVLAWQVYAPSEPVSMGSRVYLAIRYNPAALNARAPVKRKAKPPFNSRAQRGRCIIRGPCEERRETFVVEAEDWACVEYTPRTKGKHDVVWAQESGGRPKTNPWVRAEFVVRRRRRTTARKDT